MRNFPTRIAKNIAERSVIRNGKSQRLMKLDVIDNEENKKDIGNAVSVTKIPIIME